MLCLFLSVEENSSGRPEIRSSYWWPKLNPGAWSPDAEERNRLVGMNDCIFGLIVPHWFIQSDLRNWNSDVFLSIQKDSLMLLFVFLLLLLLLALSLCLFVSGCCCWICQSLKWPESSFYSSGYLTLFLVSFVWHSLPDVFWCFIFV